MRHRSRLEMLVPELEFLKIGTIVVSAAAHTLLARPEQPWWMAGRYMGPQCLSQVLSTANEPGRD
jgi:hypothetical protein